MTLTSIYYKIPALNYLFAESLTANMVRTKICKRIIFTNNLDKVSKYAILYFLFKSYKVLNLNLIALNYPDIYTLKINLTDSGQVFNTLSSHFNIADYLGASAKGKLERVFSLVIIKKSISSVINKFN